MSEISEMPKILPISEPSIVFVAGANELLKFSTKTYVNGVETEDGKEIVSAFREWMGYIKKRVLNWDELHISPPVSEASEVTDADIVNENSFTLTDTPKLEVFKLAPSGDIFYKGDLVENDLGLVKDFNFYTVHHRMFNYA